MEYVYSTEPLISAYQYTGWLSVAPAFGIGLICALITALVALSIDQRPRTAAISVLIAFCAFPMLWIYQSQRAVPMPNTPVVGVIDSYSNHQELTRVSKHREEMQWKGYVLYRVGDVRFPVKITAGVPLPDRAVFYQNPRHLAQP